MKKLLLFMIGTMLAFSAYGQSKFPPCQGTDATKWSNCFGTATWPNGDKYVGQFKDGNINGQGTYYFLANNQFKGDKYVGEFKDGKMNGQGTYTFANGDKYVGEFKDGKYHGQGTYTYADGEKYVGAYKDGLRNGQGTYTYADGAKYVGEYKAGERSGQGTYAYASGHVEEGIWADDKFIRAEKIRQK